MSEGKDPEHRVKTFREALKNFSALTNRLLLAGRAGMQFGTKRDLWAIYGYNRDPQFSDCLARYVRSDIAKRIVDAPPAACWTNPPTIRAKTAGFSEAWEALTKTVPVWHALARADKLAGLGRYSVLLVGFDDGQTLDKPVRKGSKVMYLQPYGEGSASIDSYVRDPKDPRYALPEVYQIKPDDPQASTSTKTQMSAGSFKVHHSRILHVSEGVLENEIFGIPRLLNVFNLLDDLAKVCGGSAEMFWLNSRGGMQIDVDKDVEFDVTDAAALSDEIEEFQHQLSRVIKTRGVEINQLKGEAPTPKETFEVIIAMISGTTGIPRRILIGSEAGQLASNQDRANWADRIKERRKEFAEPRVLLPFIRLLVAAGSLPDPSTDLELNWPNAFQMSPLEQSQASAQLGRTAINLQRVFSDAAKASQPPPQPFGGQPGNPNAPKPKAPPPKPSANADEVEEPTEEEIEVPNPDDKPEVEKIEPIITREEARAILEAGFGEPFEKLAQTTEKNES